MGHLPKNIIVKITSMEYIYLFHPRYLHDDIFRYMTLEITHLFHAVISGYTAQVHYPCSYSNRPNF